MSGMKNVVTVMFQISVVVKGIERRLTDMGCNVKSVVGNIEEVEHYLSDTALFIVYLPSEIMDDPRKIMSVSKVCKMVMEKAGNIIFIGEWKFHDELTKTVPEIVDFEWVDRPVDMNKFMYMVENILERRTNRSSQKRILIIDDDPTYAKMVREWIKDSYRVDIVTAGMQAISFLLKVKEDEQVDLILLDYEMPVVDGPQVLQMLRQDAATAKIPVIFLTGVGTKEAVARVMELKPEGYILKSTTRDALLKYLEGKLGYKL
ncbi:MAG: response regulator [Lachnospiraceae bacterium]|nr:response regulator [Lachnospiraceae bacterium]